MKKMSLIVMAIAALTLTACQTTSDKSAMAAEASMKGEAMTDTMKGDAMKDTMKGGMKDTMSDTMKS